MVRTTLWSKKYFRPEKMLVQKKLDPKKTLLQKKGWSEKKFGQKNNFSLKTQSLTQAEHFKT